MVEFPSSELTARADCARVLLSQDPPRRNGIACDHAGQTFTFVTGDRCTKRGSSDWGYNLRDKNGFEFWCNESCIADRKNGRGADFSKAYSNAKSADRKKGRNGAVQELAYDFKLQEYVRVEARSASKSVPTASSTKPMHG